MCGGGGKIDCWVLRMMRDFESEREKFFFFFEREING